MIPAPGIRKSNPDVVPPVPKPWEIVKPKDVVWNAETRLRLDESIKTYGVNVEEGFTKRTALIWASTNNYPSIVKVSLYTKR
jgi:hypothetical protein